MFAGCTPPPHPGRDNLTPGQVGPGEARGQGDPGPADAAVKPELDPTPPLCPVYCIPHTARGVERACCINSINSSLEAGGLSSHPARRDGPRHRNGTGARGVCAVVCHHDVEGGSCPAEREASALLGGAHRVQCSQASCSLRHSSMVLPRCARERITETRPMGRDVPPPTRP